MAVVADSKINKTIIRIIKGGEMTTGVTILHRIIIYKYQTPNLPLWLRRPKRASSILHKIKEFPNLKCLINNMSLFLPKPESCLIKKNTGTKIKLRMLLVRLRTCLSMVLNLVIKILHLVKFNWRSGRVKKKKVNNIKSQTR